MKEIIQVFIDEKGETTIKIISDKPGHSELLLPFEESLSNGDKNLIKKHIHDHNHTHNHIHNGRK